MLPLLRVSPAWSWFLLKLIVRIQRNHRDRKVNINQPELNRMVWRALKGDGQFGHPGNQSRVQAQEHLWPKHLLESKTNMIWQYGIPHPRIQPWVQLLADTHQPGSYTLVVMTLYEKAANLNTANTAPRTSREALSCWIRVILELRLRESEWRHSIPF